MSQERSKNFLNYDLFTVVRESVKCSHIIVFKKIKFKGLKWVENF